MKVLFFGKKDHRATRKCLEFLDHHSVQTESYLGARGDAFPDLGGGPGCDLLISFSSPWILPPSLLQKAAVAALNFHPGPPEYPGIGCTNFAIYHERGRFGVTCHHMHEKVDSGPIVKVERFPLLPEDSVKDLTDRCYCYMYSQFVDVIGSYISGRALPESREVWTREPYTRRQLNDLCRLDPDMDRDEIVRRVRATAFPGYPGAYIELYGMRFYAQDET